MLYAATKGLILRLFRAPTEPPEAPGGEHRSVAIFRASPRFLAYRLLGLGLLAALLALCFVGLVALAIFKEREAAFAAGGVALFSVPALALGYFLIQLDYDLRYYVITDRSVRVREGAWNVRELTLTYANVQNLRVTQGPLQRLFGIRDLRIDAAGGGGASGDGKTAGRGHHVVVAGVEDAVELRDRIQAFLRQYRAGAGLGDPEDDVHGAHGGLGHADGDPNGGGTSGGLWLGAPEVLQELRALREVAAGMRAAAQRRA